MLPVNKNVSTHSMMELDTHSLRELDRFDDTDSYRLRESAKDNHELGESTSVGDINNHKLGESTSVANINNHKLGESTIVGDINNHKLGESTSVGDINNHKLGESTSVGDINNHKLGESTSVGDINNHKLGESTSVGDINNHKLGESTSVNDDDEESIEGIHFFPPLYIQRYNLVLKYLTEHNIKSVIDFGCSECGFMQLLPTVPSLERIALVDVDRDLLVSKKWIIRPELRHHIYRRVKPLHVVLLAGNAEETDTRLLSYEAVTLIEVIEHLYPPVLENVVHNVFGKLTPRLCIVTTPNSEFNILFGNDDPKQFRHWDHKFEWTRQEFHQWCQVICQTYGYSVEYTGVGSLSARPDTLHLGPCSQAAIFTQIEASVLLKSVQQHSMCYELIAESDFPYETNVLPLMEKIDLEVAYCLRQMMWYRRDDLISDQSVQISVSKLAELYTIRALCDENGVRDSLQRGGHRLSPDGLYVILDFIDESRDDWCDDAEDEDSNRLDVQTECLSNVGQMKQLIVTVDNTSGISQHDSGVVVEENWDIDDS